MVTFIESFICLSCLCLPLLLPPTQLRIPFFCLSSFTPISRCLTRLYLWSPPVTCTHCTHSHTDPLTHSLTHSHTHSLTHIHTHFLTHIHTHSLTHIHTHSLSLTHTQSLTLEWPCPGGIESMAITEVFGGACVCVCVCVPVCVCQCVCLCQCVCV